MNASSFVLLVTLGVIAQLLEKISMGASLGPSPLAENGYKSLKTQRSPWR
ncbi:MAG: hypothetical protein LBB11_02650 [Puniceicoccales bacterium]|nr:hypothetical protein [Puniceicoccales bacterium]